MADAGDPYADGRLVDLVAERDDLDGLLPSRPGRGVRADWLAYLLTMEGRDEEAERLRRFGLNLDRSIRCA
jgi:hypothetical protein